MPRFNPWANRPSAESAETAEPEYSDVNAGDYGAPENLGPAIPAGEGWAPKSTTDPVRLGDAPRYDTRPNPTEAPEEHYAPIAADRDARHSVETVGGNGWAETMGGFGHSDASRGSARWAANPRAIPPPVTRITATLAPRSYFFVRPFMQRFARALNGLHFSMADHRREGEIYGMAPARQPGGGTRNTFRLSPQPWDTNIVDTVDVGSMPDALHIANGPAPSGNRSWRLS